ncbi:MULTISPECIES: AAA family ATPase [unclassified Burkholderia]|uniref:AAA family ATPase n=1 Tax=unclassified Burkholderia TaxID=2613784 RepID=UPI002AAF7321|nr:MULTISPECIES: AAA family ATPase [unclassified Burkholderia]
MRISSFRVQNYKCFFDTGEITLAPGFNIFVGRNDAGKSALAEALSLMYGPKPHRSLTTAPTAEAWTSDLSTTDVTYAVLPEELKAFLSRQRSWAVPLQQHGNNDVTTAAFNGAIEDPGPLFASWANQNLVSGRLAPLGLPQSNQYAIYQNVGFPTSTQLSFQSIQAGHTQDFAFHFANSLRGRTYAFRAERMNVGQSGMSAKQHLEPNAANLPDVLNQLSSGNPARYERLMAHVRTIFPHITQITAPAIGNGNAQILVWTVPVDTERADLAVPLTESGTGIGQVLAMLYVVVTSHLPNVIIIDEPQSFLHPGAVRKLLEILREYSQHQYVVTTHSPVVLTLTESDRMFLVRREASGSTVVPIDPESQDDLRLSLTELGVRLGDVFGSDWILWVEGKTEETCFPEIIRRLGNSRLHGVQILGVISTDELSAKMANRVYEVYTRLSGGPSLLPPAVAFMFDREGRSEAERADIDRKSGGLVQWLPLRMYENYLLEPLSIASVISALDTARAKPIATDEVREWLERNGGQKKYFASTQDSTGFGTATWQQRVHGAQILHDMFGEFTEFRLEYDKVKHGLMLTRHLIDQPTPELRHLAQMLSDLVAAKA